MRIVFMGSASLACPSLDAVLGGSDEVVAVVTQPDRPKGRRLRLSTSPVKVLARKRGVAVLSPSNVNSSESVDALRRMKSDLIVVLAYGQILKREVLALPPQGCVNMHASLLPRYRGAAPIQWAIANGERITGVSTMFMNERMDAGDVILQKEVMIGPDDTAGFLHDKLAEEGAVVLSRTLDALREGRVTRTPQVESQATFAPKLSKEDGRIDWTEPAERIYNRVRGFNPWPCCFCEVPGPSAGRQPGIGKRGNDSADRRPLKIEHGTGTGKKAARRLRVLRVVVENATASAGEVIDATGDGPLVGTGDGTVRLLEVQPEGRNVMSGADYLRGHDLKIGDAFR